MNNEKLVEIIKQRNIKHAFYFHVDHFEPWSRGANEDTARGVDRFAMLAKQSRFAAKLNLFYHTYLPYNLDQNILKRGEPGQDAIVFGQRSPAQDKLIQRVMRPLEGEGDHEIHVHVHHESWTRNTGEYSKVISKWVNENSNEEMDKARLNRALLQTKEFIARDIGRPIERWAFVHGNWALNGSDRSICWIDDEIELLMQHGCFGDFTFPAGRGHCDPVYHSEPYTCLPIKKAKGYDSHESMPLTIYKGSDAFQQGRFFIWNSLIKASTSSLDYYYGPNRDLFKKHEWFVQNWLEKSVVLNDVLYIKTHAHSMKTEYEIDCSENPIPHLYPDIKEIFNLLERVCESAGVALDTITVNNLMDQLQDYVKPEAPIPMVVNTKSPVELAVEWLGEAMTAWLDGSEERNYAAGDFYKVRIAGGRWLEDYELAVVNFVLKNFNPATTRITEIGIGLGTLTAVLAALGYKVYGVEGDPRRSAGAVWIREFLANRYPAMLADYTIVQGYYPDVLTNELFGEDKQNILVSTNLIHSFSAKNQDRILKSALLFDNLILDKSRFGINRTDKASKTTTEGPFTVTSLPKTQFFPVVPLN